MSKDKLKMKKKGQSTLEYIILVTGVIIALLVFLGPGGIFNTQLDSTYSTVGDSMQNMANRLLFSRP